MTGDEVKNVALRWSFDAMKCTKSLYEISKIDNPRQGGRTRCIENKRAGAKTGIWFDEVIADWTNLQELHNQNKAMPHRIDGCYVKGDDIFLIEFKSDGDWMSLKDVLWAKFHDSYSLLIDRNIITVSEAQSHLYYIVVSSARQNYSEDDIIKTQSQAKKAEMLLAMTSRISDCVQRPWRYKEIQPKANLREITAFTCKAAYTLDSMQFDRFVEEMHWT